MFNETNTVGLDFETYSDVDLPTEGLANYVASPNFTPLIAVVVDRSGGQFFQTRINFVEEGMATSVHRLKEALGGSYIAAHNSAFEKRVLDKIGIHIAGPSFIDTAAIARAAGAGGKLEAAAPQLLGQSKVDLGAHLIKVFSIPGKLQDESMDFSFNPEVIKGDNEGDWKNFMHYCWVDAQLSLRLALEHGEIYTTYENLWSSITVEMNETGWPVDVPAVVEMKRRYEENMAQALVDFRTQCDAPDLNLNSLKQMKEWCLERGVKAKSFSKDHVERMIKQISPRANDFSLPEDKRLAYEQVLDMLTTKQTLGGSSLKKLDVVLRNVTEQGRIHDQYLHIGAGQTWRTSGRSVQMQNLKRLGGDGADMSELEDENIAWDNLMLSDNIRQVFCSKHPQGRIIVGDFSSVESRGLAYLAGQEDKLKIFRAGMDPYVYLAEKMTGTPYTVVTKPQRQLGKVGELSCGYGAAWAAVQQFAHAMGTELSEAESMKLVADWRSANDKIVQWWWDLDNMLHRVVETNQAEALYLANDGLRLQMYTTLAPQSLQLQAGPAMMTLNVILEDHNNVVLMHRVFHGVYMHGRNVRFFKPSERKTGDLWRSSYTDPKTKERRFYEIYGGKLAGILTQSFCREIFFQQLQEIHAHFKQAVNVQLIGQFHDEIVLDWQPRTRYTVHEWSLDVAERDLGTYMSQSQFQSFPMAAEIKSDYRYIK